MRSQGARHRVTDKGKLSPVWRSFLWDNDNKTDLFNFPADNIVERCQRNVNVTSEERAVSNQLISLERSAPINHEEAESRFFLCAPARKARCRRTYFFDYQSHVKQTSLSLLFQYMFQILNNIGLEKLWIKIKCVMDSNT